MNKDFTAFIIVAFIIALGFLIWQNNNLKTTYITYENDKLSVDFEGFSIVQISDLHSKKFGKNHKNIIAQIKRAKPNIILITGDLIDRRRYDLETSIEFIKLAIEIAPIYYVAGNHEAWSHKYADIKAKLLSNGVFVLDNEKKEIKINDSKIEIIGLKDPAFDTIEGSKQINLEVFKENLANLTMGSSFKILLSHRPEIFDLYHKAKVDLIFSGHAHGGQVRLPIIGGLFSPNQGFLPKYTSGKHKIENSTLIVSGGLGNSLIPLRIFNNPELIHLKFNTK